MANLKKQIEALEERARLLQVLGEDALVYAKLAAKTERQLQQLRDKLEEEEQ